MTILVQPSNIMLTTSEQISFSLNTKLVILLLYDTGLNCNLDDPSPDVSLEYCSSPTDLGIDYEMCKKQKCPANTWLVSVLLAFYALLTCIMMLNVLIAMFKYVMLFI